MTLSANEALARFKENEERFNKFINDAVGYTSTADEDIESLPAFLEREGDTIAQLLADVVEIQSNINQAIEDINTLASAQASGSVAVSTLLQATSLATTLPEFSRIVVDNDGANNGYYHVEDGELVAASGDEISALKNSIGQPNGIASLDADGFLPLDQLGLISPNLFNPGDPDFLVDYFIRDTTGLPVSYPGYDLNASGYIPVIGGHNYSCSGTAALYYAWYTSAKVYISGGNNVSHITAPANAAYLRTTVNDSSLAAYMVVEGDTLPTPYIAYGIYRVNAASPLNEFWLTEITNAFTADDAEITAVENRCTAIEALRDSMGSLSYGVALTINLQTKQLVLDVPGTGSGMVVQGSYYKSLPTDQTVSFTHGSGNYLLFVYIRKSTGVIGATQLTFPTLGADYVPLAVVYLQQLHANDPHNCITLVNASGAVVVPVETSDFDANTQRMILPDEFYFLYNTPLPLFKAPIFADYSKIVRDEIKLWLDTKSTADYSKRYQPINEMLRLDPAELDDPIEIGYRHSKTPNIRYIKSIGINMAANAALNGKSLMMLNIGDSLTEQGMITDLKATLEAQGVTVTCVGTYPSTLNGSLRGEGRGYWCYREFIGKDNYSQGVGAHTRSSGGKTDTTKFETPFLKVADATAKANHPDWCFRFTGAQSELSYTDDTDKTGDFYIFDFGWYRTQHSVAAPDFITIALSTNDINLDLSTYTQAQRLQYARLGLEIMIKQIKADLPDVIIGIIPAYAWSSTQYGDPAYQAEVATWIENCITDVNALSGTYSNLFIVPVWPFMSEDLSYAYASSTDLSAINTEQVKTISDWVHFDAVGRQMYANVVVAWLANAI